MGQFVLTQGNSCELEWFPHIKDFALRKNITIQFDSFSATSAETLRLYYVVDGKFEWIINHQPHILYPGDIALVLPGQEIGGSKGYLDIGTLFSLHLDIDDIDRNGGMVLGRWSSLSQADQMAIGKVLTMNNRPVLKLKDVAVILHEMRTEIVDQGLGYLTRVNQLLDNLLIVIARHPTRQASSHRDFPKTFMKLEHTLRQNLGHQWTVEEMSALFGLCTTSFTEKVKNYTGFSPLNYLINIRISEAIKLLKKSDVKVTNIALETGFYSSQHFSTTFKKLTGYTPGEFRKINTSGN